MSQFDDGTPAWAAGAIRAANDTMAARGMGASSLAAAAIVQASMESASVSYTHLTLPTILRV